MSDNSKQNEISEDSVELSNKLFNNYHSSGTGKPLTVEAVQNAANALNEPAVLGANQRNAEGLIDRLLPEQEAKIPEYVKRFKEIGLNTTTCNRVKAEAVVRDIYQQMGKPTDHLVFLWEDSPFAGAIKSAKIAKGSEDVTLEDVRNQAGLASYGSFESYWAALYSFISNELPVKPHPLYEITTRMVQECGVFWTFDDYVVMTDRPCEIHMKDEKLHNDNGFAIKYRDGKGIYAFNGDRVDNLLELKLAARKAASGDSQDE